MDKEDAAAQAVDDVKRNYGEEIDTAALVEALERYGWVFEG
jgi:hypothetical protein